MIGAVGGTAVAFLALIGAGARRLRRTKARSNDESTRAVRAYRTWRTLVLAAAGSHVAFALLFGFVFGMVDPQRLFQGFPAGVTVSLTLPILTIALTAGAMVAGIVTLRHSGGSVGGRLWYGTVTVALGTVLLVLAEWNMVGFQY